MRSKEQAKKIYQECVASARAGNTIEYREVLDALGYQPGVSGQAIRYGLELVRIACADIGLPSLPSIVVNQSTGTPADGGYPIKARPWEDEVRDVFDYQEWPDVNDINWEYTWDNRQLLSAKHETPGYWGG